MNTKLNDESKSTTLRLYKNFIFNICFNIYNIAKNPIENQLLSVIVKIPNCEDKPILFCLKSKFYHL